MISLDADKKLSIYCDSKYDGTKDFAAMTYQMCELMVNRVMAYRKKLDPAKERQQFFDLRMQDLSADPVGTVRRIYAHFGLNYTQAYEIRLQKYIQENGTGDGGKSHGSPKAFSPLHEPFMDAPPSRKITAEDVGLDPAEIDSRFAEYIATYVNRSANSAPSSTLPLPR